MRTDWKIFARQPSHWANSEDYAADCYASDVIAVGWNDVGDLNQIESREALKARLAKTHPADVHGKPGRLAQWAAALWHFGNSVHAGDFVICPDRDSDRVYIGRILSKRAIYRTGSLEDKCPFAHRRHVRWFRVLSRTEIKKGRKGAYLGGQQTVTKIKKGLGILSRFLRPARVRGAHRLSKLPWCPDQAWGRKAEERALKWLKDRGDDPCDVAHKHYGWDIECGRERYEVKGRRSSRTTIRLTENEWRAARHFGKRYTVLLFTAPTELELKTAIPQKIPNPVETAQWQRKASYEYFLIDR